MLPGAIEAVKAAQSAIDGFIGPKLLAFRDEMNRQVEVASTERAKSMVNRPDGRMVSTPPKKSSTSKVAVCERCLQPIAIISDDICQPIRAHHFKQIVKGSINPFMDTDIEYFKCLSCKGRPFQERDRILTNAGFRMVPPKPEAVNLSTECQPQVKK